MAHPCSPCYLWVWLLLLPLPSSIVGVEQEFIYDGFLGRDLTLGGEASVTADGLLRLTSGQISEMKGHAFHPFPLNFTNNGACVSSFSTTFVLSIKGHYPDLSGHGLAFVLSSTKDFLAPALPAQYLGLLNLNDSLNLTKTLFAIEFDTIEDTEFKDIDSNHVGIDVNSMISVASRTAGYYDSADGGYRTLNLISGEPIQVWVDYNSGNNLLNVTIAPCCLSSIKPSQPLLAIKYDLSSVLTTTTSDSTVFAGFSAATGTIKSVHHILGWSLKLNGEAAEINYTALPLKTIQELAHPRIHHNNGKILWAILAPVLVIATAVSAAAFVKVHKKRQSKAKENKMEWEREYGPPSFNYKDLLAATSGFKDKMLLGRGGFGSVFRGVLPCSKQTVAIKRISPESKQGMKEFMAEIIILGHIRHRNLVQLLGYCRHKQQLLLVYDYMPNRSLDWYLHTSTTTSSSLISWAQRFHIIKGVVSGLLYLHEEWEQVIIHRDIKSSNVLLDAEMNARLGDFGLARSHDHGADAHTTHMAGTWGYIAPELARLGKATTATDVFALGVLMLEVVSARRPIWVNAADGEPLALADWVLAAWRAGSITNAIDPRLLGAPSIDEEYVMEEVELVLKLGLLCSHPWPNVRPCMRVVMQYLQRDAQLPNDLHPDSLVLMSDVLNQNNNEELCQHIVSCPLTTITDLSKGR